MRASVTSTLIRDGVAGKPAAETVPREVDGEQGYVSKGNKQGKVAGAHRYGLYVGAIPILILFSDVPHSPAYSKIVNNEEELAGTYR